MALAVNVSLSACGKGEQEAPKDLELIGYQYEDTSAPIVTEKGSILFNILSPKNPIADDYNDMLIFKNLYDMTNVDINWNNIGDASYQASKSLIMADKRNLPDAIYHAGFSEQEIILYSSRKQIIALDDYLEYMPNFKKILEDKLIVKNTGEWVSEMEKEKIPCGPIFNIKEAVENPQIEARNMIVKAHHKVIGDFKLAGNPIKMSNYKDEKTRGDIPDLDEHREKILKEFSN